MDNLSDTFYMWTHGDCSTPNRSFTMGRRTALSIPYTGYETDFKDATYMVYTGYRREKHRGWTDSKVSERET